MKKRIFLLVSGLSPQVVTETLYAFFVDEGMPDEIPSEVFLITTKQGAEHARLSLLTGESAQFYQLMQDYRLHNITFTPEHIRVIHSRKGQPLEDIRTPEENAAAADFICQQVQQFTAQPELELHVSLAGGRKTMGYYVGYALSLFGREQDTLSHVLISSDYESHPHFFYPTPQSRIIYNRDQKPLDSHSAEVTLARIPFVRLRQELPPDSLVQALSFSEAVNLINSAHQPPRLQLNLASGQLLCNQLALHLERMDYVFYLWFISRALSGQPPVPKPFDGEPNQDYGEQLSLLFRKLGLYEQLPERSLQLLTTGIDGDFFLSKKARINRLLRQQLGQSLAEKFMIQNFGSRGQAAYGLALEPESIEITGGTLL